MRFATKFDRSIVALLILAFVLVCLVLPFAGRAPLAVKWLPVAVFLLSLPCSLPQYYEVRDDGLLIRQGWRKLRIPYAALVEVRSTSDSRSAVVFSTDRIAIVTSEGKSYTIAVAEEDRFIAEVAKRAPHLQRIVGGLGLSFSA